MLTLDLIGIGSSLDVSDAGRSVAEIEEGSFGGTCLNRAASRPRC